MGSHPGDRSRGGSGRRSRQRRTPPPPPHSRSTRGRERCVPRSRARSRSRSRLALLGGLGLAVLGAFLVDRSRRSLLGLVGADAAILVGVLDVLVLPFALVGPGFLRHRSPPRVTSETDRVPAGLSGAHAEPEGGSQPHVSRDVAAMSSRSGPARAQRRRRDAAVVAILAALVAFGSRFASKVLTTALGWASTLLFGRVPASRQILLLGITFGSV